ncbi:MAG: type IV pilus assembly protein PilV [Burkholderiaceae bacterium]
MTRLKLYLQSNFQWYVFIKLYDCQNYLRRHMRLTCTGGFTLLEVLISLLVLAFGVLGVLTLLLFSVRVAQQVDAESVALHLANEIADQLRGRASTTALAQFDYDAALSPASTSAASSDRCYGLFDACNTNQLATFMADEWRARIKTRLPTGRVRICRDAAPWQMGTNSPRWECDAGTTASAPLWIKIGWQGRSSFGDDRSISNGPQLVLHVD